MGLLDSKEELVWYNPSSVPYQQISYRICRHRLLGALDRFLLLFFLAEHCDILFVLTIMKNRIVEIMIQKHPSRQGRIQFLYVSYLTCLKINDPH